MMGRPTATIAAHPFNDLLVDAYAAQHPGTPSPQAIQSVAVHLMTLYGVLVDHVPVERALWLRRQALSERQGSRQGRFQWLTPPSFAGSLSVAAVAQGADAAQRAILLHDYIQQVWAAWAQPHGKTIAGWYAQFIGRV